MKINRPILRARIFFARLALNPTISAILSFLRALTKPRFFFWWFGVAAIWALVTLVVFEEFRSYASRYFQIDLYLRSLAGNANAQQEILRWEVEQRATSIWMILYGTGLFALGVIAFITPDPFRWKRFGRLVCLVWAVLAVVGLPLALMLPSYLPEMTAYMIAPETAAARAFLPLLPPLCGLLTLLAALIALIFTVGVAVFIIRGVPMLLYYLLAFLMASGQVRRTKQDFLAACMAGFGWWLRGEDMADWPDDSKGARFATPREIQALRDKEGMAFGHIGGQPFRLLTDKHILIMASTRSGKGVALIIPHLLTYPGSAFVLDPKGENARACGRRRGQLNAAVHVLDPFGLTGLPPSRFNPLARFTPANMEAESKALAAALFALPLERRDHWSGSGQQLLALFIMYVHTAPEIPAAKKDLVSVRRLLLGYANETLAAIEQSDLADGALATLARSFTRTPERELGSIISTAQRETEILDNPNIAACLAASGPGPEVNFTVWRRSTMTVFLCLAAPQFPVFSRWLRLVLSAALDEMTARLDPPPLPVCFMLDELATLGHLEPVENAVGLAAGYGVQLVTVWQDVGQMRDLYRGRWASFINNAGVRVLFNLDDYDSAHYWSQFIGGQLVGTMSQAQDVFGITEKQTVSEALRPLLSPDQIMLTFAADKMLVLHQGSRPISAERVPYFEDEALKGLWDDPRGPTVVQGPWSRTARPA